MQPYEGYDDDDDGEIDPVRDDYWDHVPAEDTDLLSARERDLAHVRKEYGLPDKIRNRYSGIGSYVCAIERLQRHREPDDFPDFFVLNDLASIVLDFTIVDGDDELAEYFRAGATSLLSKLRRRNLPRVQGFYSASYAEATVRVMESMRLTIFKLMNSFVDDSTGEKYYQTVDGVVAFQSDYYGVGAVSWELRLRLHQVINKFIADRYSDFCEWQKSIQKTDCDRLKALLQLECNEALMLIEKIPPSEIARDEDLERHFFEEETQQGKIRSEIRLAVEQALEEGVENNRELMQRGGKGCTYNNAALIKCNWKKAKKEREAKKNKNGRPSP